MDDIVNEDEYEERGSNKCLRFWSIVWQIFTCLFTHVMLVSMVVGYCIIGAKTFEHLEKDYEILVKMNISQMRRKASNDLWISTKDMPVLHQENWTNIATVRVKQFESELIRAMKKDGWDGNEDQENLQWTFAGALFYSLIVITTIGYGHIAPKTPWGKVTTIFYAIVGIPLMLLCLSNIGDIMARSFRFLYWKICCYACTRDSKRSHSKKRSRRNRNLSRSRNTSLRVSGRESQRSNETAMVPPDSMYSMPGVHDIDIYIQPDEDGLAMPRNLGAIHRDAQHGSLRNHHDPDSMQRRQQVRSSLRANGKLDDFEADLRGGPVLFNRYALEPEFRGSSAPRGNMGLGRPLSPMPSPQSPRHLTDPAIMMGQAMDDGRWSRRGLSPQMNTGSLPERHRASERSTGSSKRRDFPSPSSSPRVMTPMGFMVPRQSSTRSKDDHRSDTDGSHSENQAKPVPIWLCVLLVFSYIIGGTILFSDWEEWPYSDSAYFCFITLTTIGFGDFVPARRVNKKNGEMSIALCSLYLLFGIALLAMSFNLVQEEVINNVKQLAMHMGIIKDPRNDNDSESND